MIRSYLFIKNKTLLRIKANKVPSLENIPQNGTWVVNELYNGEWVMPCFPEITWGTLKKFDYLGILTHEPKEEFVTILVNKK